MTARAVVRLAVAGLVLASGVAQAQQMYEATQRWDVDQIFSYTHPSIFKLASREELKSMLEKAGVEARKMGLKFEGMTYGTPGPLYEAGEEEVCFLPTSMKMAIADKHVETIGFLAAIRPKGGKSWKYLGSDSLQKDKQLLWVLLPKLPKDVELPPTEMRVNP